MNNTKQWRTTLMGVVTVILLALTTFGVISTEERTILESSLGEAVTAGAALITAIISIFFAKDKVE